MLTLPKPLGGYSQGNEAQTRAAIERADKENVKRTDVLESLKIKDTVTGQVRTLTVASGVLVIT